MMKFNLVFLYLFSAFFTLLPQNTGLQNELPFVTDLQIYAQVKQVLLKWVLPTNSENSIFIYRSDSQINEPDETQLIVTLNGSETEYIDTVTEGSYYYAILLQSKETGIKNKLIIPYRNTLPYPVKPEEEKDFSITSITATSDNYASISWTVKTEDPGDKFIYLYRNITPIKTAAIMEKSTLIARINARDGHYHDYIVPGIPYYYAVKEDNSFTHPLKPGVNFTTKPVTTVFSANFLKTNALTDFVPLPLLALSANPINGQSFDDPQILQYPFIKNTEKKILLITSKLLKEHADITEKIGLHLTEDEIELLTSLLPDESIFTPGIAAKEYTEAVALFSRHEDINAAIQFEAILSAAIDPVLFQRISYYLALLHLKSGNFYTSYLHALDAQEIDYVRCSVILRVLDYNIFKNLSSQ